MRPAMFALVVAVITTAGWSALRGTHTLAATADHDRRRRRGCLVLYARQPSGPTGNTIGDYEEAMLNGNWIRANLKGVYAHQIPELFESAITKATFGLSLARG